MKNPSQSANARPFVIQYSREVLLALKNSQPNPAIIAEIATNLHEANPTQNNKEMNKLKGG